MAAPPCSSISPPLLRRGAREAGGVVRGARHHPPPSAYPSSREKGKAGICARSHPRRPPLDHALAACARSPRRRLPREPELDHAARDGLGLLHVREMPRVGDLLEFRPGNALAVAPAV